MTQVPPFFVARQRILIPSTTPQPQLQLGLDSDVRLSRKGSNLLQIVADTVYMKSVHVVQDFKIADALLEDHILNIIQEAIKQHKK